VEEVTDPLLLAGVNAQISEIVDTFTTYDHCYSYVQPRVQAALDKLERCAPPNYCPPENEYYSTFAPSTGTASSPMQAVVKKYTARVFSAIKQSASASEPLLARMVNDTIFLVGSSF
jgi:hypothetical protein